MMRRWIVILAVGLLVMGALPALAQQGQGFTYTVRGGDTMAAIAARYDVSLNELLVANGLTNPNTIFAGQVLVIPASGTNFGTGGPLPGPQPDVIIVTPPPTQPIPTQPVPTPVTPPPTPAPQLTYTVQPGDSLTTIAAAYGVTVADLATANGIENVNLVARGRVLVLPAGAVPQVIDPGSGGGGTGGPLTQYVVEYGDVLELIAEDFDTTVAAIAELNDLDNPGILTPGDVLLIP